MNRNEVWDRVNKGTLLYQAFVVKLAIRPDSGITNFSERLNAGFQEVRDMLDAQFTSGELIHSTGKHVTKRNPKIVFVDERSNTIPFADYSHVVNIALFVYFEP